MEETASRYGGQLRIHRISSLGQPIRCGPRGWWLGEGLTTHHKVTALYEMLYRRWEHNIRIIRIDFMGNGVERCRLHASGSG